MISQRKQSNSRSGRQGLMSQAMKLLGLGIGVLLALAFSAEAQNVTMQHNDIGRTGQNTNETILTPANVTKTSFGKLFSVAVDGYVYAQPLYVAGVTMGAGTPQAGTTHNVVFIATENDSVYAFDADTNGGANSAPLWHASLIDAAHGAGGSGTEKPVPNGDVSTGDISPIIGITSTPVIDTSSNTIYVVAKSTVSDTTFMQRLHALDITTGQEKFGGPMALAASVNGTGNGSSGGTLKFDPKWENQRPGLLLLNGIVYIAFAAHGDNGPWHGWVLAYNAKTLAQTSAYCASPNAGGSGIWMSGAGLAADVPSGQPYGRMFLATGNGAFDALTPYTNNMDYGDSHVRLDLTNGVMTVQDSFTPSNQATLNGGDKDVGAGGVLLLPVQSSGGHTHLLVQGGKEGKIYLVDRDNMGGYSTSTDNDVEEITGQTGGFWSMPAYWNNTVYEWSSGHSLQAFPLNGGKLSTTPSSHSSASFGFPGATPSVSSNGTTNGIVWALETNNGNVILFAFDATNVATELYDSTQNGATDQGAPSVKFAVPTVVNGKVYVGAQSAVDVYGLTGGVQQAATPVISPAGETFTGSVSVSITDSISGAAIYYTTDGSTPSTSSTKYAGPITVGTTETISAVASLTGFLTSGVAKQTYTLQTQVLMPTFSPGAGSYTAAQNVTISDATANSQIYYTTDGSTPSPGSGTTKLYSGAISVGTTTTINAMATAAGLTNSPVASSTYTIVVAGTGINFSGGFANSASSITFNGSTDLDDTRLQLTSGGSYQAGSAFYDTPVNIQSFTTTFLMQLSNPAADGMTFTIQGVGPTALGPAGGGLGYGPDKPTNPDASQNTPIGESVAVKFDLFSNVGEGANSTGMYENGASPTLPSIDLTPSGINLHSGDAMTVQLTYDGTTLGLSITDNVAGTAFSTSWPVNIPSLVGGNSAYVGFTAGTGGSTSSQKILSWTWTSALSPTAAAPTITPAAGTYTLPVTVTMTDSTAGASIYYTLNGTTPSAASTLYTAPFALSAPVTVEAIAVASGYANSAVTSNAYAIQAATPVFSPVAGNYTSSQNVTITDTTPSSVIYYTLDGSTPTTSSSLYTGPVVVNTSETLSAIATAPGLSNSQVMKGVYTIAAAAATPTFTPAAGTYSGTQSVTISDATSGTTIHYTTNGTTPTASSPVYSGPISVTSTETIEAIAVGSAVGNSAVATAVYTIVAPPATPTFTPTAGTYTGTQSVTISDATSGATIYYTTNGTAPTIASTVYTGPVSVASTQTLQAIAVGSGGVGTSTVATAVYTIAGTAATPTFSPGGGTYTSAQTVTISDATSGTTIHYTTNGTTPTATSPVYTAPIAVTSTETIQALAVGSAVGNSAVGTAVYTIAGPAATPTFSPVGGNYTSAQSVTISDATAGTTIYYTTNGTTPTTTSTVYSGPIPVTSTETIQAIAAGSTVGNSAVATAVYTIAAPAATPAFSPAGGTYSSAQTVTISDATAGTTIYYTTNGTMPTMASTLYTGPISVATTETLQAIAVGSAVGNSAVGTASYTITGTAATPTFSPGGGTYANPVNVAISDATAGTTIYYTTNGTMPTAASTVYAGPIAVTSSETLQAIAVGTTVGTSGVAAAVYTITVPAATPTFSPAAGSYTSAQTVTINETTAGTTIYYTTNGTTPTTASTVYSGPIPVTSTETIQAIASGSSVGTSAVSTATYTITGVPDFSLSPASTSLTVKYGAQVTDMITIAPQHGAFGSAVQLTCTVTGPAPMPTCAFAPASVTPGGQAVTSMMTITAPAATGMVVPVSGPGSFTPNFAGDYTRSYAHSLAGMIEMRYAAWAPLALLALLVFSQLKKNEPRRYVWLCGLVLLAFLQAACAGSVGSNSSTPPPTPTTQSYSITISGASTTPAIQHTIQVTCVASN